MKRILSISILFFLLHLFEWAQTSVRLSTSARFQAAFSTVDIDCLLPHEEMLEVLLHDGQKISLPYDELDRICCFDPHNMDRYNRLPFFFPDNAHVAAWAIFSGFFPEETDCMDLHYYQTLLDGGDKMALCLPSDQRKRERKVMGTVTLTFPEESASIVVH